MKRKNTFKKYKDLWNGNLMRTIEFVIDIFLVFFTLLFLTTGYNSAHFGVNFNIFEFLKEHQQDLPLVFLYVFISSFFFFVYQVSVTRRRFSRIVLSIFLSLFFTNITLIVLSFIRGSDFIIGSPMIVLMIFLSQFTVFAIYKYLLHVLFARYNCRKTLIFGTSESANRLALEFYRDKNHYRRLSYVVFESEDNNGFDSFLSLIPHVDDVLLAADISESNKNKLTNYVLLNTYKELYIVPKTYEINILSASQDQIDDTLLIRAKSMHLTYEQRFFKRTLDIFGSIVLILVALIPMTFIALSIKIQDKGPILYKQIRIKRNNKEFYIYKFRSMYVNADAMNNGPKHASSRDPRITKIGRYLRATRLDELPQLFNVLRGEMSLVGPRPLIPSEIDNTIKKYPEFIYRSNIKPGLTGFSQVYSQYDIDLIERLRFDMLYVRKYNFFLDIKIMLLTIRVMFSKEAGLGKETNLNLEQLINKNGEEIIYHEYGYEII